MWNEIIEVLGKTYIHLFQKQCMEIKKVQSIIHFQQHLFIFKTVPLTN